MADAQTPGTTSQNIDLERVPTTRSELFEFGRLYFERCEFSKAIENLSRAASQFFAENKIVEWLECQSMMLRMYAERNDQENIQKTKEYLQDLVLKQNIVLNAKIYYTLALCSSHRGQQDLAEEYLNKALQIAIKENDNENLCYALLGMVAVHQMQNRLSLALAELDKVATILDVLKIPRLEYSMHLSRAVVLGDLQRPQEALDEIWRAYALIKSDKNLASYIYVHYNLGLFYKKQNDKIMAKLYFNLAKRSLDPKEMVRLNMLLEKELEGLGVVEGSKYDLVLNLNTNSVHERGRGAIDFKNQFLLLDLLKIMMAEPGRTFSKEEIVDKIWHESYDPSIHDNKIYVTIKRLRQILEPDEKNPKYIFRSKNGYYLNQNLKVKMQNEGEVNAH